MHFFIYIHYPMLHVEGCHTQMFKGHSLFLLKCSNELLLVFRFCITCTAVVVCDISANQH